MIYGRTNIFNNASNFSNILSKLEMGLNPKGSLPMKNIDYLRNCKFENDDIFYHHPYYEIDITNFLDDVHWEHMRNNKNVKLLHMNPSETFGNKFAISLINTIQTQKINPNQIYLIVFDMLHKNFLVEEFKKHNIYGINIGIYNTFFTRTALPTTSRIQPIKKFSALSRNFKKWRLKLYLNLVENDLLDEFVYSFHSINPYEKTTFDIFDFINKENLMLSDKAISWISNIPYKLKGEEEKTYNKLSNETFPVWGNLSYDAILSSDFNLVVESVFEYKSLISLISEKTYKAIVCSKPFLMFGSMGFLSDIRQLGYKTFSPYIDETYDTIADNEQRLSALVNEIKRIKNLSDSEYLTLLSNCNFIANENFKIFQEKKAANINEDNFNTAFDFLKPHLQKFEGWDFPIVIL